jgi:hypothetical protein
MIKRFRNVKYLILDANTDRYSDFERFFENSYRLIIPDINIVFVVNNIDNVTINPQFDIEAVIEKFYNILKVGFRVINLKVLKSNRIFYDYCVKYFIPEIDDSFYSINGNMVIDNINQFNYQIFYVPTKNDWIEIVGAFAYLDSEQLNCTRTAIHIDFPILGLFKPNRIKVKPPLCQSCKYFCPNAIIDCAVHPGSFYKTVFDCKDYEFTEYPQHAEMYDELA